MTWRPKRRIEARSFAKRRDGSLEVILEVTDEAQPLPGPGGRPHLQFVLVSFFRGREVPCQFSLARDRQLRLSTRSKYPEDQ